MKKSFATLSLVLMLIFSLSVSAFAASKASPIFPTLSFRGTSATCSVTISKNTNDEIEATISLWNGSNCVDSWSVEGTTYLRFEETATVTRGKTYTLKVDAVIDGISYPTVSVSGKCS